MLTSIPRTARRASAALLALALALTGLVVGGAPAAHAAIAPPSLGSVIVLDASQAPVAGASVRVSAAAEFADLGYSFTATTDGGGVADLVAALQEQPWGASATAWTYTVYVEVTGGDLQSQYWDGLPSATTQVVTLSSPANVHAVWLSGSLITTGFGGLVTDGLTGNPIDGARVASDFQGGSSWSGSDGSYQSRIAPGSYRVTYEAYSSGTVAIPFGYATTVRNVTVTAGAPSTNVNVALQPNGRISGTVNKLVSGSSVPVEYPGVIATSVTDPTLVKYAYAAGDGSYGIDVPAGSYTVAFTENSSDTSTGVQYYNLADNIDDATPVTVTAKQETTGINGLLGYVPALAAITAGTPIISGAVELGATLTAAAGSWSPAGVTLEYQWYRGGVAIGGATGSTHTLTTDDIGHAVTVRVAGSKAGHTPASAISSATALIVDPNPGSVSLSVENAGNNPVAGAQVSLARATGGNYFAQGQTDSSGLLAFASVPSGEYTLTVHPVASGQRIATRAITVAPSTETRVSAIILEGAQALPTSVTLESATAPGWNGLPGISRGEALDFSVAGTPGAVTATYAVTQNGETIVAGTLAESPAGIYGTVVPRINTAGEISFEVTLTYAGGATETVEFDAYIDPSGTIVDSFGTPVVGATVTLLHSATQAGTYTPVPNGSTLMSPRNRTNPSVSDAAGVFGWDVVAGWYKVVAEATLGGQPVTVTTVALPVPPEYLDLVLALPGTNGAPTPTTAPVISGTRKVGQTLTVSAGTWPAPAGDRAPIGVSGYQWTRDGLPIAGATGAGYRLVAADVGKTIAVTLTVGRTLAADAGTIVGWQYKVSAGPGVSTLPVTGVDGMEGVLTGAITLLLLGGAGVLLGRRRRTAGV